MIVDAGPALNFFATNNERLLLDVVGGYLSAPVTVRGEVIRKSRSENRFRAAETVWTKLESAKRITVLPDDVTDAMDAVIQRLTQMPMTERLRQSKDLGEMMVVAHAAVAAQAGRDVSILIDEGDGARMAMLEARRFDRLRAQGQPLGVISLYNTAAILFAAARKRLVADRGEMRNLYARLRQCDDGLIDIRQTKLLSAEVWSNLR